MAVPPCIWLLLQNELANVKFWIFNILKLPFFIQCSVICNKSYLLIDKIWWRISSLFIHLMFWQKKLGCFYIWPTHLKIWCSWGSQDVVSIDPNALIHDAYSDDCIFFLRGKVNKQNCRINKLRRRITDVVTAISQATLHAVWREMQDSLDICRATNGAHVVTLQNAIIKLTKLWFFFVFQKSATGRRYRPLAKNRCFSLLLKFQQENLISV
jgi:hypothetical protein